MMLSHSWRIKSLPKSFDIMFSQKQTLIQTFLCKWFMKEGLPGQARKQWWEAGKGERRSEVPATAWSHKGLWSINYTSRFVQSQGEWVGLSYTCASQSLAVGSFVGQGLGSCKAHGGRHSFSSRARKIWGMGIQNTNKSGMRASDAGPTLSIWAEKQHQRGFPGHIHGSPLHPPTLLWHAPIILLIWRRNCSFTTCHFLVRSTNGKASVSNEICQRKYLKDVICVWCVTGVWHDYRSPVRSNEARWALADSFCRAQLTDWTNIITDHKCC